MESKQEEKDLSQTLEPLSIMNGTYKRPPFNLNHLRLYGHHLCPFVERVRLVLAAKNLAY